MRFYKLSMSKSGENDIVCHYKNDYGIESSKLQHGSFFDGWDYRFEFYYSMQEGNIWTDYLANDKGWFLVSQRLKNLLDVLNTKIQYFKVKVREINNNGETKEFYIANILKVVDALCLGKSKYYQTEINGIGTINIVSKYGIYVDKTDNADVFKLADRQVIPIFVSENFKELAEQENITGLSFYNTIAVEETEKPILYDEFEVWLNTALDNDIPDQVIAINCNLYEDADNYWSIDIIGAAVFDEKDDSWACEEVTDFGTRENMFRWHEESSWEDVLSKTELMIEKYIENGKYSDRLKEKLAVSCGFVSGDLHILYQKQ